MRLRLRRVRGCERALSWSGGSCDNMRSWLAKETTGYEPISGECMGNMGGGISGKPLPGTSNGGIMKGAGGGSGGGAMSGALSSGAPLTWLSGASGAGCVCSSCSVPAAWKSPLGLNISWPNLITLLILIICGFSFGSGFSMIMVGILNGREPSILNLGGRM